MERPNATPGYRAETHAGAVRAPSGRVSGVSGSHANHTQRAEHDGPHAAHTADLIAQAGRGDFGAFEALYRAHVGRVFSLCLRLVADAQLAEDLTQESFVRLWEKLETWRGDSAFTTWFHRLVVNVVFDRLRADQRRSARLLPLDDAALAGKAAPRAAAGLRLDLERAIAELPAAARAVFVLHDVEGYRHAEVADLLGIAEGTSKAHLHRARRMLREVLHR